MGAYEDGQTFLAGVLAKIPDAGIRAQVQEALTKVEAKDAVTLLGDGVLARTDYSKHMDAIAAKEKDLQAQLAAATDLYEKNATWYKANKTALEEYPTLKSEVDRLKAGGGDDGGDDGGGKKPVALDKKTIEETIASMLDQSLSERERGYVDVVAFMQDTGMKHLQRFGTPPDMRSLVANPKIGKPIAGQPGRVFSLADAYQETYGAEVAKKDKEAYDKQIEDQVQKRLAEEKAKLIGQPFPLRDAAPSVLDVLATKEGAAAHTLDTAVAAYEALQAGRGV